MVPALIETLAEFSTLAEIGGAVMSYAHRNMWILRIVDYPLENHGQATSTWFVGPIEGAGEAANQSDQLQRAVDPAANIGREIYIEPLYSRDETDVAALAIA